ESSEDDADDEDKEEAFEDDDEEEEEHLASVDSCDLPAIDPALIAVVAATLPLSSLPTYLLSPSSSPLPHIPSPPLPIPSPPLPLPSPPTHTIPTYAEAPLGYRVSEIQFEIGESLSAAAARQAGHTLSHRVDYRFIDTMDVSICTAECRAMTAIGEEPEVPAEAPQSSGQAPPSPDYVHCLEYPPLLDYVLGLEEPEQAPIEDQPLSANASLTIISLGYVADFDLKEDPEEDPEDDPVDYPADERDEEEESSEDDADDEDKEEAFEDDDEEEEEHLASVDSCDLPAIDPALIAVVAATLPLSSSPTYLLSPSSSPLLHIPSPPLPIPSLPLPLPSPPTHTIPTYAEAPLGYRVAEIQLRAASLPTHNPSEIPSLLIKWSSQGGHALRKRARFTDPTSRFEIGESLSAAAARQAGHTLSHRVDYRFIDTMDVSICATECRAMTVIGEVNERVTDLATT
nr:hypothetical protein [Tanacetum cinerariifolium]